MQFAVFMLRQMYYRSDQIWQFATWATFQSLWKQYFAQIDHILGIFVKLSKSFVSLGKSFMDIWKFLFLDNCTIEQTLTSKM